MIWLIVGFIMGLGILTKSMMRWRINLFGKNTLEGGRYKYVYALQNGEDVPLNVPFRLELGVEEQKHGLDTSDLLPEVFAGPPHKLSRFELSEDGRLLVMEANALAPLETWVIQFTSEAHPRNVTFRFGPPTPRLAGELPRRAWPRYLNAVTLRQGPLEESELPGKTPRLMLLVGTLLLVFVVYATPVLMSSSRYLPFAQYYSPWSWVDGCVLLIMFVLSLIVFRACRLRPYPVIQGYLKGRHPARVVRSARKE